MRLALHLRITIPSLIVCMLLSGNFLAIIQTPVIALTILLAWVAFKLQRYRQGIETSYLVGFPLYCALRAWAGASLGAAEEYMAWGLCGSVYGLTWFGLDPASKDPAWRRWTTVIPIVALVASCLLLQARHATPVFNGPGLGLPWITQAALGAVVAVFVAEWRRPVSPTAVWSFAAAVTLCIAVRVFQNLQQANALDLALVFIPYTAGVLTTVISRHARLFHNTAEAEPVGEQLRPLG